MSGTGTPEAEVPVTLVEQDGSVPETVIPAEPVVEALEAEPEAPAAEAAPAKPSKPAKKPWFQERIDELTRQRRDAERERDELKAKIPAEEAEPAAFDPKNFDALVKEEAIRLNAAEKTKARTKGWWDAGAKEFGGEVFNDKCATVAAMGAGDSPEFMQIITDPDVIPDGHKVVAALADNPDEAQRILGLPPIQMAAALTRFGATATVKAAEKPLSSAPAPIKPIGGSAKASEPSDADDIKTWAAKRNAQAWDTRPRH